MKRWIAPSILALFVVGMLIYGINFYQQEQIEQAKEPLYTTKPNLERSGMGFTIIENFMDSMEVKSVLGLGTKVTMTKSIQSKEEKEEDDFLMLQEDKN